MSTQSSTSSTTPAATPAVPSPFNMPGTAWDPCAERYSIEATHMTQPHATFTLEKIIKLQSVDGKKLDIGDIACGSGAVTLVAAKRQEIKSIIASDYSAGMVAVTERKAKELAAILPSSASIRTLVADAQDLSAIPDNSLDCVLCVFALMMIPNPEKAANEMVRITKPGGLVAIVTWATHEESQFHGFMVQINKMLAARKAEQEAQSGTAPLAPQGVPVKAFMSLPYSTFDQYRELHAKVGLETISLEHYTSLGRPMLGVMDYWNSLQGVAPMFHKRTEQEAKWVVEFVDSMWGSKSTFSLTGVSVVAIGRKPL